jgi:hypothetical protein
MAIVFQMRMVHMEVCMVQSGNKPPMNKHNAPCQCGLLSNDYCGHVHRRPVDLVACTLALGISTTRPSYHYKHTSKNSLAPQCSPKHATILVMCEIIEVQYVYVCPCKRMAGPVRSQTDRCEQKIQAERVWWHWYTAGQRGKEPSLQCASMYVQKTLPYDKPCRDCFERFFRR